MNICIVGQYPPMVGGVSTYCSNLRSELERRGHNVYVLTYYQKDNVVDNNVFMAGRLDFPVLRALSFIIEGFFILRRIKKEFDIDIIHANYLLPPGLISVFNKKGTRIVVTAHGSDINILPNNVITKRLLKYIISNASDVYFVSKELQKKALEHGLLKNRNSQVTPNTVNTEKFKPQKTEANKKPKVIFIGNLVKQKGLKYLLEAKKEAKTSYTLEIYGEGPEKQKLQEYINKHKLSDTHLMGKTRTPEKIIPHADIMVLPSIHEGASIISLESMSCGKALISTDTGNIKEVITNYENGIIIEKENPHQLNQAIETLLNNTELRKKIGENARKSIIEKYSKMKIPYIDEVE